MFLNEEKHSFLSCGKSRELFFENSIILSGKSGIHISCEPLEVSGRSIGDVCSGMKSPHCTLSGMFTEHGYEACSCIGCCVDGVLCKGIFSIRDGPFRKYMSEFSSGAVMYALLFNSCDDLMSQFANSPPRLVLAQKCDNFR